MIRINCDLCGKVGERLFKAIIEGVELNVCSGCSKFGKVIGHVKKPVQKETRKVIAVPKEEKVELLIENYAEIIKKKRESMGLTQKDFANRINEKEATIHKLETGAFTPPISLARKLEKTLGIKLVEEHEESHSSAKERKIEGFTLGDFIKIKK
ncbi:TIGR00270 family protein [Candidatus Woesearchaeota archaeon]|nr:TIGR00270 family protein [Candidatus Woesearchaeota archaeon]